MFPLYNEILNEILMLQETLFQTRLELCIEFLNHSPTLELYSEVPKDTLEYDNEARIAAGWSPIVHSLSFVTFIFSSVMFFPCLVEMESSISTVILIEQQSIFLIHFFNSNLAHGIGQWLKNDLCLLLFSKIVNLNAKVNMTRINFHINIPMEKYRYRNGKMWKICSTRRDDVSALNGKHMG